MREYRWKPIEPLSARDRALDLAATKPLYESWHAASAQLRHENAAGIERFTQQLVRRLSVETGILERLYDVDRGTTEALVAAGFREDLVSRSSTDIEPAQLVDILRSHEAAIQLVMDCIAKSRNLTKGLIHELHAILTTHQVTTVAVDEFGKRFEVPLVRGQFKMLPNNPSREDGAIHEYCPPIQVDSEMEELLGWLAGYDDADPVIVAAWAHHRFTQIHPYQDGNGRVARALTTMLLLRAELLPVVIDRDQRLEYLDALEDADFGGGLGGLASLFARLERNAILQALSIDTDSRVGRARSLTSAVIESLAAKFDKRRGQKSAELRSVNELAMVLRARCRRVIETTLSALREPVSVVATPVVHVTDGGPDRNNAHWYRSEVIKSSESSGKFVNFDEAHYFVKASFRVGRERLVFVTSFHHVGRELSGIMEVTAFARLESFEDSDDRESVTQEFSLCSSEPFVVTWKTSEAEVTSSFDVWLDAALAVAVKQFGDRL
jgi:Fic family protein